MSVWQHPYRGQFGSLPTQAWRSSQRSGKSSFSGRFSAKGRNEKTKVTQTPGQGHFRR